MRMVGGSAANAAPAMQRVLKSEPIAALTRGLASMVTLRGDRASLLFFWTELVERLDRCNQLLTLARVVIRLIKRIHELDELGADLLCEIIGLLAQSFERFGVILLVRERQLL